MGVSLLPLKTLEASCGGDWLGALLAAAITVSLKSLDWFLSLLL